MHGSDSNAGTEASPFRTPGRLARSLAAGQTGCLRAGVYTETSVEVGRDGTTLTSYPGTRAIWRGRIHISGDRVVIARLALDGSAGTRCRSGSCSGGVLPSPTITGDGAVLRENDIQSRDAGICVHPVRHRSATPTGFLIEGNRVHDCGRKPATNHDHGIYVQTAAEASSVETRSTETSTVASSSTPGRGTSPWSTTPWTATGRAFSSARPARGTW